MMTRPTTTNSGFSVEKIRADFPILSQEVNGQPLAYFDNAATSQKPVAVIERLDRFYREGNANIHRGVHALSQSATEAYESARARVAKAIGANESREIVFTRGATEAINLVAAGLGKTHLSKGDDILLTELEHHANIVPWQILGEHMGLKIHVAPVFDDGSLDVENMKRLIAEIEPGLVAFSHASNALGCIQPAKDIISCAHAAGALVLLDGAQSTAHFAVDVSDLDCDFLAFSGHKVFGPTGIGVLYGKADLLGSLPPYQGGGDMIERVSFKGTTFRGLPERFEAGTPHIAGAVGLAEAFDYIDGLGRDSLEAHEVALLNYATEALSEMPAIRILGGNGDKVSLVSFLMEGVHPHDIASFLDAEGIAVRTGHHCAQPLMERLGIPGTTRASFAFYNTFEEIDRLIRGLHRVQKVFGN